MENVPNLDTFPGSVLSLSVQIKGEEKETPLRRR
jgi:hypothetical protein